MVLWCVSRLACLLQPRRSLQFLKAKGMATQALLYISTLSHPGGFYSGSPCLHLPLWNLPVSLALLSSSFQAQILAIIKVNLKYPSGWRGVQTWSRLFACSAKMHLQHLSIISRLQPNSPFGWRGGGSNLIWIFKGERAKVLKTVHRSAFLWLLPLSPPTFHLLSFCFCFSGALSSCTLSRPLHPQTAHIPAVLLCNVVSTSLCCMLYTL